MFQTSTLPNGLRVVSALLPHARSVSSSLFHGVGSRHEQSGQYGIAHYVEHMLFKGTRRRPTPRDVSVAIEQLGGILNAETGKEVTVYWTKLAAEHWKIGLDLICDLTLESTFDTREVEKERAVILEEIAMLFDSPADLIHLLIDEVTWPGHPLGRDIAGDRETLLGIRQPDLVEFARSAYAPHNAVVAVCGPVTHEAIVDEVARLYREWRPRPGPQLPTATCQTKTDRVLLRTQQTEQAHLCLSCPGVSYFSGDRFAFDLLNVILGEGMSSRLFVQIREILGLAYDVHTYVKRFRDTGALVIYAGVEPIRAEQALVAVLDELRAIARSVPEEEIRRAKEFWKGRLTLRMEDTGSLASWSGSQEILLGHVQPIDDLIRRIDAVTPSDLARVAAHALDISALDLAIIGPFTSPDPFVRILSG
ncbi:MAG: insulinase family protein [Chloroflexi bacterium]|nr:insulinase family protein [Chloroflexota bacterium]